MVEALSSSSSKRSCCEPFRRNLRRELRGVLLLPLSSWGVELIRGVTGISVLSFSSSWGSQYRAIIVLALMWPVSEPLNSEEY